MSPTDDDVRAAWPGFVRFLVTAAVVGVALVLVGLLMKTVAGGFLVLAGLIALLGSLTFGVMGWRRRPHLLTPDVVPE